MQILKQQEQREIARDTLLFMNYCPVINGAGWGKLVSFSPFLLSFLKVRTRIDEQRCLWVCFTSMWICDHVLRLAWSFFHILGEWRRAFGNTALNVMREANRVKCERIIITPNEMEEGSEIFKRQKKITENKPIPRLTLKTTPSFMAAELLRPLVQ